MTKHCVSCGNTHGSKFSADQLAELGKLERQVNTFADRVTNSRVFNQSEDAQDRTNAKISAMTVLAARFMYLAGMELLNRIEEQTPHLSSLEQKAAALAAVEDSTIKRYQVAAGASLGGVLENNELPFTDQH
jgi:hypothetical protein